MASHSRLLALAVAFLVSLLVAAATQPFLGNQDCWTKINKVGANYYIQCNNTTCDNGTACAPQTTQVGSVYYHICRCESGGVVKCNGVLKSNSDMPGDPGFDVLCQIAEPDDRCPLNEFCDEEQLDSDDQTFERLCACKAVS